MPAGLPGVYRRRTAHFAPVIPSFLPQGASGSVSKDAEKRVIRRRGGGVSGSWERCSP
ncbi:hypothetical protein ASZ90_010268 [hydrocarbon metagenome]|uniref:Uncharacterized protein n=1 Tax=hydrocarbon metagenome TaxID=938273 RepID=A0A0W8FGI6_9ZZZZ